MGEPYEWDGKPEFYHSPPSVEVLDRVNAAIVAAGGTPVPNDGTTPSGAQVEAALDELDSAIAEGGGGSPSTDPLAIQLAAHPAFGNMEQDISAAGIAWSPELALFVSSSFNATGQRSGVQTSPDGINWTIRRAYEPQNGSMNAVAWSPALGLFAIAINTTTLGGLGWNVQTSPDGVNWTSRLAPAGDWTGMCWAPALGLFVAVARGAGGDQGRVMTSPDGIVWTARAAPLQTWEDVAWSPTLALLVAVSGGGGAMTSPDGINWTQRAMNPNNTFRGVTWASGPALFIAVASAGGSTANRVQTSPDGINWTPRAITSAATWFGVTWSQTAGLAVAVANDGRVMTSPDGTTWTDRAVPIATRNYSRIAFGAGLFVSPSLTGTDRISTSPDGINWTARAHAKFRATISLGGVVWSPELALFVTCSAASATTTNNIMTSPDGLNWTPRTTGLIAVANVCWSPGLGLFVGVGTSAGAIRIITSPDGIVWTARAFPVAAHSYGDVVWAAGLGLFVAVSGAGGTGQRIITSPDGINWTARNCPEYNWSSIVWSEELGLLLCSATTAQTLGVMTSPDGINWTLRQTGHPFLGSQFGIWAAGLGLFILPCNTSSIEEPDYGKAILTSPDGINWTARQTPFNIAGWSGAQWCPELGLAIVNGSGGFLWSEDGITWTLQSFGGSWRGRMGWSPALERLVAINSGGKLLNQIGVLEAAA